MKKQILLSLILAGSMVSAAQAEEAQQSANKSTATISELQKSDEQKKDIDDEITNARMRATLGSKSKFSFKSALSYSGGSIEKPFEKIRPNYRASASSEGLTTLSGTVGVNYRMTERDSLSFGTGIAIQNPFHGDLSKSKFDDPRYEGETAKRYEVSTPYLEYSRAYKVAGMQMISGATYSHFTSEDYVDANKGMNAFGNLSLDQTILADLGESSWSAGMSISFDTTFYKGNLSQLMIDDGTRQDDFGYGIYPFAEYSFNDNYSFRTVFGYFQNIHYKDQKGEAKARMTNLTPYQSMGIGISLTRDIYLYPNIQFTPLDIRADRTNVALSTNLNLF